MNCVTTCRVEHRGDLVLPLDENIFVVDNGCDQSIINLNSFLILSFAGVHFTVGGALNIMGSTNLELVSNTYTLVTLVNNTKVIFKVNQAFLDRNLDQTEALIQPHQMRSFGVVVDDCTKRHLSPSGKPGGQCIKINNQEFGMSFDG